MAAFVSDAQRAQYTLAMQARYIGDRVAMKMNREKINRTALARNLCLRVETLNKILGGEPVHLDTEKFLKVLAYAGINVPTKDPFRRNEEEEQ